MYIVFFAFDGLPGSKEKQAEKSEHPGRNRKVDVKVDDVEACAQSFRGPITYSDEVGPS